MKLYEIAEQYREAMATIEAMDFNDSALTAEEQQQLLQDTLGGLQDEFKAKCLAIAAFIANSELETDALRTVEKRLYERRKSLERRTEWLLDYLHIHLLKLGLQEVKGDMLRIRIKKNPPKVVVDNQSVLPDWALIEEVSVSINKKGLAEALKAGEIIPGAHLEMNNTRVEIK